MKCINILFLILIFHPILSKMMAPLIDIDELDQYYLYKNQNSSFSCYLLDSNYEANRFIFLSSNNGPIIKQIVVNSNLNQLIHLSIFQLINVTFFGYYFFVPLKSFITSSQFTFLNSKLLSNKEIILFINFSNN